MASAVAARATDELFTELNFQARLRDALPAKASFAAVPVTSATKGFVAGELTKVLLSPQFQAIWTAALTATHHQLVAVLRGQGTAAVSTSGGYIVLNTVPLINQALAKVSGLALPRTARTDTTDSRRDDSHCREESLPTRRRCVLQASIDARENASPPAGLRC